MRTLVQRWAFRWAAGGLLGMAIAAILVGLNTHLGPYAREPIAVWSASAVVGTGGEKYDSLESLLAGGDLVVVGTVTSVGMGRTFGTPGTNLDHPDESLSYSAALALEVEEILGGQSASLADTSLKLEALLVDPSRLDYVRSVFMPHRGIFVLRNEGLAARAEGLPESVATEHLPYWRLVSNQGLLLAKDGRVEGHPLAEAEFIDALERTSFEAVLSEVRSLLR